MRPILCSLFAVSLGCGASTPVGASPKIDRAGVVAIVDRLGSAETSMQDFEALDANRCLALPLLINALEGLPPVRPGKPNDWGHRDMRIGSRTAELLQALRILTDHQEYGPITRVEYRALPYYVGRPYTLNRDTLVRGLPPGKSRYYGYWFSRNAMFFAPVRTQRAIKAQYKRFLAKFDCRANLSKRRWDPDFWEGYE